MAMTFAAALFLLFSVSAGSAAEPDSPEVRLYYDNDTEYLVTDFEFLTWHEPVRGIYVENSKEKPGLPVQGDRLWREITGDEIKTIQLNVIPGKKRAAVKIELMSGQPLVGTVPFEARETWKDGDRFWVRFGTTKFGQPATYTIKLDEITSIDTATAPTRVFTIKTKEGREFQTPTLMFGLSDSDPRPSRVGVDGSIAIKADGADLRVSLKDVRRFIFEQNGEITMTMKNGETGQIELLRVSRVYGKLNSGDVVFHDIAGKQRPKLRAIDILQ